MVLTAYCSICKELGHWAGDCTKGKAVTKEPVVTKTSPIVTKSVTKSVTKDVTKSEVNRVLAWREKNKERYNEYMREFYRKRVKNGGK